MGVKTSEGERNSREGKRITVQDKLARGERQYKKIIVVPAEHPNEASAIMQTSAIVTELKRMGFEAEPLPMPKETNLFGQIMAIPKDETFDPEEKVKELREKINDWYKEVMGKNPNALVISLHNWAVFTMDHSPEAHNLIPREDALISRKPKAAVHWWQSKLTPRRKITLEIPEAFKRFGNERVEAQHGRIPFFRRYGQFVTDIEISKELGLIGPRMAREIAGIIGGIANLEYSLRSTWHFPVDGKKIAQLEKRKRQTARRQRPRAKWRKHLTRWLRRRG